MPHLPAVRPIRLLSASLLGFVLTILACADVNQPAGPTPTTFPTIKLTAEGISRDVPSLIPGSPVRILNTDSRTHRIHLDPGATQQGCGGLDTTVELGPGESFLTPPLGDDVVECAIHDHMSHGDPRFAVRLHVDSGE